MKIRWSLEAAADLETIVRFIELDNSPAALRAGSAIYKRVGELAKFPNLGRAGRVSGTRELPISPFPFLVVYRLGEGVVEIVRVLHGAQRWP
jgi:toxin ParE1/3/4